VLRSAGIKVGSESLHQLTRLVITTAVRLLAGPSEFGAFFCEHRITRSALSFALAFGGRLGTARKHVAREQHQDGHIDRCAREPDRTWERGANARRPAVRRHTTSPYTLGFNTHDPRTPRPPGAKTPRAA
jgi:hypothetical protein